MAHPDAYTDGLESEIRTLNARVAELEDVIDALVECEFDHGWNEDTHSPSCPKCIALNRY